MSHYKTLGITQSASLFQVHEAYKARMGILTPADGMTAYLQIQLAFGILKDARLRAEYDKQFGSNSLPKAITTNPHKHDQRFGPVSIKNTYIPDIVVVEPISVSSTLVDAIASIAKTAALAWLFGFAAMVAYLLVF